MEMELLVECFKAMGDKTRLSILALLKVEELCVCELVAILQISQPAISQHLRKLKHAKLVKERRKGQWVFYSLEGTMYPYMESILGELPDLSHEIRRLKKEGSKVVCCE